MTRDSSARSSSGPNVILSAWRSRNLGARDVLARVRATPCDECSQPIRWWNRRVWVVNGQRCAHLRCWRGQLLLKAHVQFMAGEIGRSAHVAQPSADISAYIELRALRASAQALRERVERLAAQLQQAEELTAKTSVDGVRNNGKLPGPSKGCGGLRPGSATLWGKA
jgi:hypothetical protein